MDGAFHQVAQQRTVGEILPVEFVPEEELERDVARLAHAAFAVLVVRPTFADAAGAVDEQAVAVRLEVQGATGGAQVARLRVPAVQFELFEACAEIAVGLTVDHLVAADDDGVVPVVEGAFVAQEAAVLLVACHRIETGHAVAEAECRLAVGDEGELPVVGHRAPAVDHVVGVAARGPQCGFVAEELVVGNETLQDEAHFVNVPQLGEAIRRRKATRVAVGQLIGDDEVDHLFLMGLHLGKRGVKGVVHGGVRMLAEADETAAFRAGGEGREEVAFEIEAQHVAGDGGYEAFAQCAREFDTRQIAARGRSSPRIQ